MRRLMRRFRAGVVWVRELPANLRNVHYRHRFFMWARGWVAITMWLGVVVLANWYYDAFLSALVQAMLVASIVCTGFALFPLRLEDEGDASRFVNIFGNLSRMFMYIAFLAAFLFAGIIAIAVVLY